MVKRGFSSFIRKVEGLPELEEGNLKFFSPDTKMNAPKKEILRCFDTPEWEDHLVGSLFTWSMTEQGFSYWNDVNCGKASETRREEAYAMLRYWKREVLG